MNYIILGNVGGAKHYFAYVFKALLRKILVPLPPPIFWNKFWLLFDAISLTLDVK